MPIIRYDRDKPSTFTEPRKCHGCGWSFDLSREGMDEEDPLCKSGEEEDRIVLCGDCKGDAAKDAEEMVRALGPLVRRIKNATKPGKD